MSQADLAPAVQLRRQRLERMLPMMRIGCFVGILGWFLLGYLFDAPSMYALSVAVGFMLLSIYAYGILIRLRGITPESGVVVVGLTVSLGAASTGYFAPWAVGRGRIDLRGHLRWPLYDRLY